MSSARAFIQSIGADRIPALSSVAPDPGVPLTPHDYFLVSRVDGRTTLRVLRQLSGMAEADFEVAFTRVLASGACRVPGIRRESALSALGLAEPAATAQQVVVHPPPHIGGASEAPSLGTGPRIEGGGPAPGLVDSPRSVPAQARDERVLGSGPAPQSGTDADGVDVDAEPGSSFGAGERYEALRPTPSSQPAVQAPRLCVDLIPSTWPIRFDRFTFDPVAMRTGSALDGEQKQVVLYYHYHLQKVTYYDLFGIRRDASRRDVKAAYFRLSKAFHPDRWYRKDTGEFGEMIEDVFKWLSRAYSVLSAPTKRKGYDKLLHRGYIGEWQLEPSAAAPRRQHPPQKVAEVVERHEAKATEAGVKRTQDALTMRARIAESSADWIGAADLYQRALLVAPSGELRIRLVECMLKATMDPIEIDQHLSAARAEGADVKSILLFEAEVARRLGDAERAVAALSGVLELDPSNPVARLGLERLGVSPDRTDEGRS